MIEAELRKSILALHEKGMSVRQIARSLNIARNTVRSIITERGSAPSIVRSDKVQIDTELLQRLYGECEGYVQRVHEKLVEEENIDVKYSTLTRMLRDLDISTFGKAKARSDRVPDEPGAEMQHDTSPYSIMIGDQQTKVVASLLYLRYSKRRYLKFYRRFNRFAMKCSFHEGLTYWGYSAPMCIIDNTNLARLRGTGKTAVMVPEMIAFAQQFGFEFVCHEIKHSNRKAGNERGFWTVETNFFPGRSFASLEDLNEQAIEWATVRLQHRPVGKAGLIPAKAFDHERAYLVKLPAHLPAPYLCHDRGVDQYGYVALNSNYFWVPGTGRVDVQVLEYSDHLKIYRGRLLLAEYRLPADGVRHALFSSEDRPRPRRGPTGRKKKVTAEEEARLRAMDEVLGSWLDFALEPRGIQRHRAMRDLFQLSKQMRADLFVRSVTRAMKYRIKTVETIRRIAIMYLNEDARTLPDAEVDERLLERNAYQEGRLTDEPSFSDWDEMLDLPKESDTEHTAEVEEESQNE